MRDTFLYDLDGTLLDTLDDLADAVNAVFGNMGFPAVTKDKARAALGNGARRLIAELIPEGEGNPHYEETVSTFRAYYREHCTVLTKPYPGIEEMLARLSKRGALQAIVSNKPNPAALDCCDLYFPGYTAIGEKAPLRIKPAPDMILEAVRQLGSSLDRCVYIGDSEVDIETGKNAGIPVITVSWGFRSRNELIKSGASVIADSAEELEKILTSCLAM
ncbi:MAG: HAD family hydrolase [bacterium]|nr:HAD family hydrolase [bacterium]